MSARGLGPLLALALALATSASCADLPAIPASVCGNGVLEAGEDCDGSESGGTRCRRPDEASACRFDCSTASCPAGWLCGPADGVCREPTGAFSTAPVTFEAGAGRILTADLDGDGRKDVIALSKPDELGRTTPRVFFFDDATSGPAQSLVVRATTITPTAGDMDGDGRSDLVFSSFVGVNVLLGEPERSLAPLAFAQYPFPPKSQARLARIKGYAPYPTKESPVVFVQAEGVSFLAPGSNDVDSFSHFLAMLDRAPSEVAGEPLAADVIEGEASPCDEVLWAWRATNEVSLVEVCKPDGTWKDLPSPPTKALRLPATARATGLLSADLDRDGHADLLVTTEALTYVGFGRGDGTFSGAPGGGAIVDASPVTCALTELGSTKTASIPCVNLLATSPSDHGGAPLVVFPEGIVRVTAAKHAGATVTLEGVILATKSAGAWTVARIADLNANGHLDVVAGSSSALDLDFFNGTPEGFVNPSKIATDAPVSALAVGDFDGDLVNDLALTELEGDELQGISVAYGRHAGAPEEPYRMGEFPSIRQIAAARTSPTNTIEAIGLVYDRDGDSIAVLAGEGDRQLLSPFGFANNTEGKAMQGFPVGVALGAFDETAGLDVAALAVDVVDGTPKIDQARFWVAGGVSGHLSFAIPSALLDAVQLFPAGEMVGDAFMFGFVLRAADLDGDGRSEVVLLAPTKGARTPTLLVARPTMGAAGWTLAPSWSAVLPIEWPPTSGSDLQLADVDGDGKLDAVMLVEGRRGRSTVSIAWGDGGGGFDVAGAAGWTPPSGKITGIAIVQSGVGPGVAVAALAEKTAVLAKAPGRVLSTEVLPGLAGGQAIASGDVDGDGIPDLLVASGPRISVHHGIARQR